MSKKLYFVVMAAGSGTRMGSATPKQFLPLGGEPILKRTIQRLLEAVPGASIVTVLPQQYVEYWRNYCIESNFFVPQIIVSGGITRFHSVRNALAKIPDGAIVAVHDGVRPLVSAALVSRMYGMMSDHRALIPVLPVTDTLKVLEKLSDGTLDQIGTLDRSRIYGAQTPQFFLSEDIKSSYELPYNTAYTDDASVVSENKIPLSFVEGERYNIKITTPEDMVIAKAILQE